MTNPILNNILFSDRESLTFKNIINFKNDLFTTKLGHKVIFESSQPQKINPFSKSPKFFKNIGSFPKSNSNNFIYFNKKENSSNKLRQRNKPFFSQKSGFLGGSENNKQMSNTLFDTTIKSFRTYKNKWNINKENIKEFKKKKIEFVFDLNKNKKEINISNHSNNENSKESPVYKPMNYMKLYFQKLKTGTSNKSEKKFNKLSILSEENKSIIFIKSFYESFIEINTIYDTYDKYKSLINKFNETYFYLFEIQSFPNTPMNNKYLEIYKISSILIIILIFLSKDENLYKENIIKMKQLLEQYIYLSIKNINYKILKSEKINNFMNNISYKESKNLIDVLNEIINLLFLQKINEYKKLRKCLKQLTNNIDDQAPVQILSIVNNTILYHHNYDYYLNDKCIENKDIQAIKERINKDEKSSINSNVSKTPFIKKKTTKKYCLIFDLDETLIHNMNFPFGEYFFVRPGVASLLEGVHDSFEIIIFSEQKKKYVYNIIDKIDINNYVEHVLYKKHIINEEGNDVKKLELIGRDSNKTICVDNSENNWKYDFKNLYKISSWYNNVFDDELIELKEKLLNIANSCRFYDDITQEIKK